MESPVKVYGAVLALTAFVVAVGAGLASGSQPADILSRAIVSMTVCFGVGLILGSIAGHAVDEHLAEYVRDHPVTDLKAVARSYILEVDEA